MQLAANQQLDRYTVLDMLGQGGMAVVYRLKHNQLDTEHALKVLTLTKPSIRRRLLLEGKVQASLRHQNVVAVNDVLNIQGAPGLLMEYIAGPSMEDWLERYRPNLDEIESVFRDTVKGVAHAHKQGLIHRDLKPANVMIERIGDELVPKVADFGLAKALAEDEAEADGRKATRTGVAMGTPAYMAPEQIRSAKDVDVRADVYSLGCMLYEMVTGHHAFEADDLPSIFDLVLNGSYEPVSSVVPDVPARFLMAIHGAMAVDKNRRIPDCDTLLEVLSGEDWDLGKAADQTWSGSVDFALLEPKQTLVPASMGSFPPPEFSFSDEALEASYPVVPKPLPTIEEIASETMGVSLMGASLMPDGTIDYASLIAAAAASQPQKTVIIHQGGGAGTRVFQGFMAFAVMVLLFFVVRLNPTVQETLLAPIARATGVESLVPEANRAKLLGGDDMVATDLSRLEDKPEVVPEEAPKDPSYVPIVKVEGVNAEGEREDVVAKVDMAPKYYVDDEEDLPEGVVAENEKEEEPVITAAIDVEGTEEADIVIAMSTEEIAALPEDKLPEGYGAITVTGAAEHVWLVSDQGRIEPGLLLAGKYRIRATFDGTEVGAGDIHVQVGKKVNIDCDDVFQRCVKK